jgi:hypothetical protein
LLKVSRPGDFRLSTFNWWRNARISASSEAFDRKNPGIAHKTSLTRSTDRIITRFGRYSKPDAIFGSHSFEALHFSFTSPYGLM